jgi:hypothetical protein
MAAAAAVAGSLLLTVGCSSSGSSSGSTSGSTSGGTNWATASSVSAGGGMDALVAAAKSEGTLNVITLPSNWANYGTIMKDFTAKYGIKINDANPDGSSQDELNAVNQLKDQDRVAIGYDSAKRAARRRSSCGGIPARLGDRAERQEPEDRHPERCLLRGLLRPGHQQVRAAPGRGDQAAYKALPPAPAGSVTFPTQAQQAAAENIVAQQWSSVIG